MYPQRAASMVLHRGFRDDGCHHHSGLGMMQTTLATSVFAGQGCSREERGLILQRDSTLHLQSIT